MATDPAAFVWLSRASLTVIDCDIPEVRIRKETEIGLGECGQLRQQCHLLLQTLLR